MHTIFRYVFQKFIHVTETPDRLWQKGRSRIYRVLHCTCSLKSSESARLVRKAIVDLALLIYKYIYINRSTQTQVLYALLVYIQGCVHWSVCMCQYVLGNHRRLDYVYIEIYIYENKACPINDTHPRVPCEKDIFRDRPRFKFSHSFALPRPLVSICFYFTKKNRMFPKLLNFD